MIFLLLPNNDMHSSVLSCRNLQEKTDPFGGNPSDRIRILREPETLSVFVQEKEPLEVPFLVIHKKLIVVF